MYMHIMYKTVINKNPSSLHGGTDKDKFDNIKNDIKLAVDMNKRLTNDYNLVFQKHRSSKRWIIKYKKVSYSDLCKMRLYCMKVINSFLSININSIPTKIKKIKNEFRKLNDKINLKLIKENNILLVRDYLWAPDGIKISDIRLIRLLESNAVKRLLNIGQNGPLNFYKSPNGIVLATTRFEHSVGAMILALQVGGTIDEAIVALLHDVMHTAFSHTVDYLVGKSTESYHEIHKERLLGIFENELIDILGINWKSYFNEANFQLIKKNNPFAIDLADYIARDGVKFGLCKINEIYEIVKYLYVDKDCRQLCCGDEKSAKWWIELSGKVHTNIYGSAWNYAMNYYFAEELKKLVEQRVTTLKEIETPTETYEMKIFKLVKSQMEKHIYGKIWKFVENVSNEEIFITEVKLRKRLANPPIKGEKDIVNKKSNKEEHSMKLVYVVE